MLDYACGIIKVAGVQAGLTRLEPRKQKSVTPPGWAHNSQVKVARPRGLLRRGFVL